VPALEAVPAHGAPPVACTTTPSELPDSGRGSSAEFNSWFMVEPCQEPKVIAEVTLRCLSPVIDALVALR
jgi:hypothetical protein